MLDTLVVTSPLVVDIYEKDARLGSTPKILELPAGAHTLEFRFEGLKKSVTYNVEKGVSKTARVTFEIRCRSMRPPSLKFSLMVNHNCLWVRHL
jgi:hypothetical protein